MPPLDQMLEMAHQGRAIVDKVDDFLQQFHSQPALKAQLGAIPWGQIWAFIQIIGPVVQQFFKAPPSLS